MKNTKKGFTLVELLVVIAILAILASVAVVGYTSFIKKAEQSNAETEAHQIKTFIQAELMAGDYCQLGDALFIVEKGGKLIVAGNKEATTEAELTLGSEFTGLKGELSIDTVEGKKCLFYSIEDAKALVYENVEPFVAPTPDPAPEGGEG